MSKEKPYNLEEAQEEAEKIRQKAKELSGLKNPESEHLQIVSELVNGFHEKSSEEEIKKADEMTEEQKEMSDSREKKEKINKAVLDLKDEFYEFFGESLDFKNPVSGEPHKTLNGRPWSNFSREEKIKETERLEILSKRIINDFRKLAKQDNAEIYSYTSSYGSKDVETYCYIFSNSVVLCNDTVDTIGPSAYPDKYYFMDKEDLIRNIEMRIKREEEELGKELKSRRDLIKKIK